MQDTLIAINVEHNNWRFKVPNTSNEWQQLSDANKYYCVKGFQTTFCMSFVSDQLNMIMSGLTQNGTKLTLKPYDTTNSPISVHSNK